MLVKPAMMEILLMVIRVAQTVAKRSFVAITSLEQASNVMTATRPAVTAVATYVWLSYAVTEPSTHPLLERPPLLLRNSVTMATRQVVMDVLNSVLPKLAATESPMHLSLELRQYRSLSNVMMVTHEMVMDVAVTVVMKSVVMAS